MQEIPNGIIPTGTTLYDMPAPAPGDIVVIHSQGRFRPAVVVKCGPKRVTAAFGTSGTARREKAVPREEVYTVDASLRPAHANEGTIAVAGEDVPLSMGEVPMGVVAQHGAGVGSRGRAGGQYLQREVGVPIDRIADDVAAAGWPSVADDIREGVSLEIVASRVRDIDPDADVLAIIEDA